MTRRALLAAPMATLAGCGRRILLTDRYFTDYYNRFNFTALTSAGLHDADGQLEDYRRENVDERIRALRDLEPLFASAVTGPSRAYLEEPKDDLELVLSKIRADLLDLNDIRTWERNPDFYSSGITNSAFVLMARSFSTPERRLESLIQRMRAMPEALQAARANLKNPPRVYTQVAIDQLPGIQGFFEKDVPAAFSAVTNQRLRRRFESANGRVLQALRDYGRFLQDDLLPKSNGDFRLGPDLYRKKLLYDEMVDTPLDRLLQIGMDDLRRNQQAFLEVASRAYPGTAPQEALHRLERDHPRPDRLLQSVRGTLDGLRAFIEERRIVTIPSPVPPRVEETPPFLRALTFASMDTPGPFEKEAKEAFFNITLPERTWAPQQVEEHMALFNRGTILSTAVHEAYPGHYTQFLWVQQAPTKVRKMLGAASNAEGWAHYTEQMMLDEGYGKNDPVLRLGQLQDALLRNARYIVGLQMHTGTMAFEQGIDFFVKEGFQTRTNGERETKRGTSDPTYLVYTLGKLQLQKLRRDVMAKQGSAFTLQGFHDSVLREGFPPVRLLRRKLLGEDTGLL